MCSSTGSTGGSKSYSTVKYGMTLGKWDRGDPVRDWQDFLVSQGYDLCKGGVDGYFGDSKHIKAFVNQLIKRGWNVGKGKTYLSKFGNDGMYCSEFRALIRAFQRDQGLRVDGLGGKATWDAAFKNPVTRSITPRKENHMSVFIERAFWSSLAERAIKTATQTAVALIGTDAVGILSLDWSQIGGVTATATVV